MKGYHIEVYRIKKAKDQYCSKIVTEIMEKQMKEKYALYSGLQFTYCMWSICLLFTNFWLIGVGLFTVTYLSYLAREHQWKYFGQIISTTSQIDQCSYEVFEMPHITLAGWVMNSLLSIALLTQIILAYHPF